MSIENTDVDFSWPIDISSFEVDKWIDRGIAETLQSLSNCLIHKKCFEEALHYSNDSNAMAVNCLLKMKQFMQG